MEDKGVSIPIMSKENGDCRVTNFKPHFLSPQKLKLKNFSAHQQEDFLRISKLTLLLFLVPILKELWQFETWGHFFWDTL